MKKIIIRISLLFFLLGITNYCLRKLLYNKIAPYYWGEQLIAQKRNYLYTHRDSINAISLGSSKTIHQINPLIFDSILNAKGEKINSFNYGIHNLFFPENLYLLDHLLNVDSVAPKYIFFELMWPRFVQAENLHTRRIYYWMDFAYYNSINRLIFSSNNSWGLKLWSFTSRTINLVEREYNVNFFNELFKYESNEGDSTAMNNKTFIDYKGFYSLPNSSFTNEGIEDLAMNKTVSIKSFSKEYKNYSHEYLESINNLLIIAKQRGIHIIFFMPPLSDKQYQYDEVVPVLNLIDVNHKIILGNAMEYPAFFSVENSADPAHLNMNGAKLYTEEIANQFYRIKNNLDSGK